MNNIGKLVNNFLEIRPYGYVLYQLVRQQLILRYRRTLFGYFWTLLNPILMMSVTAVVFSSLFKVELKTFAIFLFAGMIPWNFFNSSVVQSSTAFIHNESLIKKIYIPKILFPLSILMGILIDSLLSFLALILIILAIGGKISFSLLFIPVAFCILFLFCFGISLLISTLTVFFRDLQYVIGIGLQALFFLTPVIFRPNLLSGKVAALISLNPLGLFIDLFRTPIEMGIFPSGNILLGSLLVSILTLSIGYVFFVLKQNKIIFRL